MFTEFRGDRINSHRAADDLRTFVCLSHEYSCVALINKEAMEIAGVLVLFYHWITGQFITFCNYVLITQWRHLSGWTKVFLFPVKIYGNKWRI